MDKTGRVEKESYENHIEYGWGYSPFCIKQVLTSLSRALHSRLADQEKQIFIRQLRLILYKGLAWFNNVADFALNFRI